jgi:uncharacterized membrane protein YfcA
MTELEAKLVLAGLAIGALVGLTGMGGGSLMTPLLVFLGVPPVKAVGTDLAYAAITKTFGAWRHHAMQNVDYRLAGWLALGSVPASVTGVFVLDRLKDAMGDRLDDLVQQGLGVALIVVGVALVVRLLWRPLGLPAEPRELTTRTRVLAVAIGAVFGFALGFTSVGSGTFFGMAMMLVFPMSASRIVGTDVFHAALLVFAAAGAHVVSGNVEFGTVGWILIGSLPGILIGAHFTGRAPERALRIGLGVTLALAGLALLTS